MSYGFNVRAADKAGAKTAVAAELDKVVQQQPVHAVDRAAAEAAAGAQIDLLGDDADKDISVSLSGSVGGTWAGAELTELTTATVSASAALVARAAA